VSSTIRPLKNRRRTAQRGKPMTQSQRWGKVVTMMPIPQGEITTSEILVPEVVPLDEAIVEADAESAVEEYIVEKVVPRKRTKL